MSESNWPMLRACALLCGALVAAQEARAQPVEIPHNFGLAHYVGTWTAGAPLRLTRNVDFDQDTLAPFFTDALFGYVFGSERAYRHGFGLGASLNLSEDGGFTEPVGLASQFVVMPAYLGYYTLDADWLLLGHLGLPVLLSGSQTAGVEVAAGLGYRLLAGIGAYAEAGFDAFPGADSTLHPSVSLELGVFLDYEVLP